MPIPDLGPLVFLFFAIPIGVLLAAVCVFVLMIRAANKHNRDNREEPKDF